MNKRRVETLLPRAMEVITKVGIADREGKVAKEYNGYIASFDASVIQSGLEPAIAFFENNDSGSQQDRKLLMRALLQMINSEAAVAEENKAAQLLKYVLDNCDRKEDLKEEIINAAIALKLAIRTFEFKIVGKD